MWLQITIISNWEQINKSNQQIKKLHVERVLDDWTKTLIVLIGDKKDIFSGRPPAPRTCVWLVDRASAIGDGVFFLVVVVAIDRVVFGAVFWVVLLARLSRQTEQVTLWCSSRGSHWNYNWPPTSPHYTSHYPRGVVDSVLGAHLTDFLFLWKERNILYWVVTQPKR